MSRIFHQYIHWLPAHLTAILFLSLKHQISLTPKTYTFKCGKLHKALIASVSLSLITASRIIVKFVTSFKFLPEPDEYHHSMLISFIIHSSAIAILIFATATIWLSITFNGNLVHRIFLRMIKFNIKFPTFSFLMPLFEKIPITAGVVLISIAYGSCGGAALGCACVVHFMLMSKKYEDYLEEFVFKTAKMIARKLFGRRTEEPEESEEPNASEEVATQNEEENHIEDIVPSEDEPLNPEDEELKRLLKEAIDSQKKLLEEKKSKSKEERQEYDAIPEGLSSLNFHMTIFLLLCIITILNIPSTLSWAKNFHFQKTLPSDPSLIPAVMILGCLSLLWQFDTPRNVHAYNFVGTVLYICAVICVVFCQDSVYRLNGIISSAIFIITIHQFGSTKKESCDNPDIGDPLILDRISKMEAVLKEANKKTPQDENEENRRKEARAAMSPEDGNADEILEDDLEVLDRESEEDNEREEEGTDESTC